MKTLLLTTTLFLILSCNKSNENSLKTENLHKKILKLEEENKSLQDSLSKIENAVLYSHIIGIPDNYKQKIGKKNRIVMLIHEFDKKLPKYEIFRIINNTEIKVGESNKTIFDYEFIPTSLNDNSPKFVIKMPYKGKTEKFYGELELDVEK